jgi:repressor LexA
MINKRIKQLRTENNLTQKELADYLGLTPKMISFYELGQRIPPSDIIVKLSQKFGVTTDYLLGNSDVLSPRGFVEMPPENKKIPIIGTVKCGPNGLAFEYIDDYVFVSSELKGDIKGFHCRGDSMTGIGIFDGDIAIVRMQESVENGELAVVIINGDEGTLKKVRLQNNLIVLEAANPIYPSRIFAGEEMNHVRIVGKVLEIRRKF